MIEYFVEEVDCFLVDVVELVEIGVVEIEGRIRLAGID